MIFHDLLKQLYEKKIIIKLDFHSCISLVDYEDFVYEKCSDMFVAPHSILTNSDLFRHLSTRYDNFTDQV